MTTPDVANLPQRLAHIPASPQLRLVPVRHHSPACAKHVQTLIQQDKPEIILIEGPADATPLMPYLAETDARPPLALYCYYVAKPSATDGDELAGAALRHRSFYPLAAFSPEWVAIREGARQGAELRFIDMPYPEQLALGEQTPAGADGHELSLLDERALAQADPTSRMVELSGCRDFNEWWDRYFESGAMALTPEDYFHNVLGWCLLLRDAAQQQRDTANTQREHYMAAQIQTAIATGKRCLVLTGGYHTEAIAQQLQQPAAATHVVTASSLGNINGERGLYLVPYTLHRLDSANDYSAGIPHCGYYQEVWQQYKRVGLEAHHMAAQRVALRVGHALQARGETVSLPDCIEAIALSRRLAALRGTPPGRPEILDAMLTALVKDSHSRDELDRLARYLSADQVGRVPKAYPVAPLVEDFRRQCQLYKLPLSPLAAQEKRLDIYRSARHRNISRLLHQLHFLDTPYATLSAGPDFAAGVDLERVREIWQVQWTPATEALLTERMAYGAQLAEAALNMLREQLQNDPRAAPQCLIEALRMGLHAALDQVLTYIEQWLNLENEFPALVRGLNLLHLAYSARNALAARSLPGLEALLSACFERACLRLNWLGQMDDEAALACMQALGDLNGLAQANSAQYAWADVDLFIRCVETLQRATLPPQLQGQAVAILSVRQVWAEAQTRQALQQALQEAQLSPDYLGGYLLGFLPIGRSLLIQSPDLVDAIGQLILDWDEEVFLATLPGLRLAFTRLKPRETVALAELIGRLLGGQAPDVHSKLVWTVSELAQLRQLRLQTQQALGRWGFGDE